MSSHEEVREGGEGLGLRLAGASSSFAGFCPGAVADFPCPCRLWNLLGQFSVLWFPPPRDKFHFALENSGSLSIRVCKDPEPADYVIVHVPPRARWPFGRLDLREHPAGCLPTQIFGVPPRFLQSFPLESLCEDSAVGSGLGNKNVPRYRLDFSLLRCQDTASCPFF